MKKEHIPPLAILICAAIAGIWGLISFRHWLIIELGLIALIADFIVEYTGTKKGSWEYENLGPMFGKLPLYVPLTYFFLGMGVAAYCLLRLGF